MHRGGSILMVRWSGAYLLLLSTIAFSAVATAGPNTSATFKLAPEKKLLECFAAEDATPTATVAVQQGSLNDTLTISLKHFKPGLNFDLFTVENSNLLSDGTPDPA